MTASSIESQRNANSTPADLRPWRPFARILFLVVGVLLGQIVLYGPSLFGQKVLLPLDILSLPGVYLPESPEMKVVVHNTVLSDLVYVNEPNRRLIASELRTGHWLAWNPHQFGGAPLLSSRFSPFVLLSVCFTSPVVIAWVQVAIAEVGAVGFYFFCRKVLNTGFWPSVVIAWCYPHTAYFIFWQGYGLAMTVCWLPWLLLMVDSVIRSVSPWAGPGLAVVTGLVVVSGQTDVAGQVLLTAGLFGLWRLVDANWRHLYSVRSLRKVIALAVAWGAGFLLACPHLLPTLEYTWVGARMERRSRGEEERPPIGLAALPEVIVPHWYGSTETGFLPLFPSGQGNLLESSATAYAGLLATLLFAPLAFCSRGHRSLNWFWIVLILISLSWQLNIPGIVQFLRLPGLNMMSHNRFVFAAAFSILAMAAVGLDLLVRGLVARHKWFVLPMGILGLLLLSAIYLAIMPQEPIRTQLAAAVGRGQPIANVDSLEGVRIIQRNFLKIYVISAYLSLFALGGWFLLWQKQRLPRWFLVVACAQLALELLWYGYGRAAQCDWSLYYPEIPVLRQIGQASATDHSRVIGGGRLLLVPAELAGRAGLTIVRAYKGQGDPVLIVIPACLPPGLAQTHGLSDVRGYDAVDPARFVRLLLATAGPHSPQLPYSLTQMMVPALFNQPDGSFRLHPILDLLGVRYLIFRGTQVPGLQPDFCDGDYWAVVNHSALPRAFIPQCVKTISDEKECLRRLVDPLFDPRKTAYLDAQPESALPSECRGTADITAESPTEINISATMKTPGVLVLSDRWDQGWQAYVNDKPVPILRANYALRGVELAPGKSHIVFRYQPRTLLIGELLALAAIFLLLAWGFWSPRFRKVVASQPVDASPAPSDMHELRKQKQKRPRGRR